MERRYQDERFEKAEPAHIRAYQLERVGKMVAHAWRTNPFYRDHWLARGGKRGKIGSFEEFRDKIPLIRKKDFVADQTANPPYGKRLAKVTEGGQPFFVFNTSGTSGQGVELHAMSERERRAAYAVSAYCYRWAGLEPGDSLFLCYGISMLGGGRIELYGLENYGLTVFPVATYDVHRKLELMRKFQPKAIMATTSYIGHLGAVGGEGGKLSIGSAWWWGGVGHKVYLSEVGGEI
jgi:phenylacetate-CoA ligase